MAPGDLIRYDATTRRWHVGVVRQVGNGSVELEFFWKERQQVPLDQVTLFTDYLATRQRVFSLERNELCRAFFNEPLYRLRADRVQTIKEALRKHGLSFQPSEWPAPDTRVKIRPDGSVVLNRKLEKDLRFEALLPRWLEALKLPPSSRDPLGFQAHAEKLANVLLPGMTVFTSRIGYYGSLHGSFGWSTSSRARADKRGRIAFTVWNAHWSCANSSTTAQRTNPAHC